jgi:membrane protein implicated in regulation of membrane protease activity
MIAIFILAAFGIEKLPLPASPGWLRNALFILLAVVAIFYLFRFVPH